MTLTFGKFSGEEVSDLPESYLTWIIWSMDTDSGYKQALRAEALAEMVKRMEATLAQTSETPAANAPHFSTPRRGKVNAEVCAEIVSAGRKSLSMKYHPDRGGCLERMQDVNVNADYLETELRRLKSQI